MKDLALQDLLPFIGGIFETEESDEDSWHTTRGRISSVEVHADGFRVVLSENHIGVQDFSIGKAVKWNRCTILEYVIGPRGFYFDDKTKTRLSISSGGWTGSRKTFLFPGSPESEHNGFAAPI